MTWAQTPRLSHLGCAPSLETVGSCGWQEDLPCPPDGHSIAKASPKQALVAARAGLVPGLMERAGSRLQAH